jgi:hypothetical protein
VWVRICRAADPDKPCWTTGDAEYCIRHEGSRPRSEGSGQEITIA